jgi:cholesterol transport system auxiliary component
MMINKPANRASMLKSQIIGLSLALGLTACTGMLPGQGPPADIYTLTPKSTFDPSLPSVSWQLVVEEPHATGAIDTMRIALARSPTRIDYFAASRWSERAPEMVQTLLVESFENSRRIVSVGREAIGLRSDYNLRTDLREFQAEYYDLKAGPRIRVRLNAKIVKQPRRSIIASQNFENVVVAEGSSMAEVVAAFDDALGRVLKQTVEWALVNAR